MLTPEEIKEWLVEKLTELAKLKEWLRKWS